MDKTYIELVRLLLESAPAIFETPHFAMKGGTAINLFIEDMPRLSVDIDVVYTDHQATRDEALKSISKGLEAVRKRLAKAGLEADVSATRDGERSPPWYGIRAVLDARPTRSPNYEREHRAVVAPTAELGAVFGG